MNAKGGSARSFKEALIQNGDPERFCDSTADLMGNHEPCKLRPTFGPSSASITLKESQGIDCQRTGFASV